MSKTIDQLVNHGKKLLLSLSLSALVSCAPTYARRDYHLYPAHRQGIALYNLKAIARDICSPNHWANQCFAMNFTESGLQYIEGTCRDRRCGNNYLGQYLCYCYQKSTHSTFLKWQDIRKIIPREFSVEVCLKGRKPILLREFSNARQAAHFAEAMNIYRQLP